MDWMTLSLFDYRLLAPSFLPVEDSCAILIAQAMNVDVKI